MCASSGVRLPFFWLHTRHAVTTFIHASRPPRDSGRMWSHVSLNGEKLPAQKAQTKRSRLKSSRLLSGGARVNSLIAGGLPRDAEVGVAGVLRRAPRPWPSPPHTGEASPPGFPAA